MSMARDVTDSSPAQPQSSSSRLANETAASSGSGPGRGPSRRNSRRALTERALAEGAARTRSKGVRARESRMSLASNSGTASPPVMSPGVCVCVLGPLQALLCHLSDLSSHQKGCCSELLSWKLHVVSYIITPKLAACQAKIASIMYVCMHKGLHDLKGSKKSNTTYCLVFQASLVCLLLLSNHSLCVCLQCRKQSVRVASGC